jgi:hypothetical protein
MNGEYTQIDIVSQPLLSSGDFENRIQPWLKEVDSTVGRDKVLIIYLSKVKDEVAKSGVNFASVVQATCQR